MLEQKCAFAVLFNVAIAEGLQTLNTYYDGDLTGIVKRSLVREVRQELNNLDKGVQKYLIAFPRIQAKGSF